MITRKRLLQQDFYFKENLVVNSHSKHRWYLFGFIPIFTDHYDWERKNFNPIENNDKIGFNK